MPFYVGKGCGRRHRVHLCDAKAGRNLCKWAVRVVKKLLDSGEAPRIEKLISAIDNDLACLIEEEYIDKYGRKDLGTGILVNCTSGGDQGAPDMNPEALARRVAGIVRWTKSERTVDEATRHRMSEGQKAYYRANPMSEERKEQIRKQTKGKGNPFYGKTHTQEAADKIRAANTGKVISEQMRRKQSESMQGKHKGKDNPYFGRRHSEEAKAKMRAAQQKRLQMLRDSGVPHWNTGRKII